MLRLILRLLFLLILLVLRLLLLVFLILLVLLLLVLLLLLLLEQFIQLLQLLILGIKFQARLHRRLGLGDVVGNVELRAAVKKIIGGRELGADLLRGAQQQAKADEEWQSHQCPSIFW